jgi:hypothetical protein
MPGLLPLIRVGSESELGRAVSQLTGLSALVDLADHARRAKTKIDKEFVKAKTTDRDKADREFSTAKSDLERILHANETLRPPTTIPQPSGDPGLEQSLREITEHFEHRKAAAFESARGILGERFDPTNLAVLSDLEGNIDRALERASQPQGLASAARLGSLRRLAPEQIDAAAALIESIRIEANALDTLARDPSIAARTRLYARVATWVADHPDPNREEDTCIVCGGNIEDALDPVTGKPVKVHMHEAALNAALLSQTIGRWAESAHGLLLRNLPEALRAETVTDLPAHPCDLLRAAFTDELFAFEPFKGVLGELKAQTAATLDDVVKNRTNIEDHSDIALPKGAEFLIAALSRLDRAIRFARWRQANDNLAREILARVIGRLPKPGQTSENVTVTGKLLDLQATVKAAKPVSEALIQCDRLRRHLRSRRTAEFQLRDYAVASAALADLIGLGQLADEQVDQLRTTLSKGAAEWRSRIYLGAFPDTAHELVDTGMGRKGEIDLVVQTGGVSAPAQHVTNASALRASLVAFFLAFWEFVLNERGGLVILALDDPQELLDDENRERLAAALAAIIDVGGQLFVTSYDPRFCAYASRLPLTGGIEHLEVHPATRQQPVVRTTPPLPVIKQRKDRFEADRNAEEPARDFADGCRVFLEAKLGDIFDDPAHAAWAMANPDPTLATFIQRLRPTVRSGTNGMFGAPVFRRFIEHRALIDKSPVLTLMNKAHHGRRQEIRAADVAQCANDLNDLVDLVEQMFEECYRWRRRDAPRDQSRYEAPPTLAPTPCVGLSIQICQDLAAFTQGSPLGASEKPPQPLDTDLLSSAAIYYLRRSNFGFAAPLGSLAVVEAMPAPGRDRSLVIARHESATYARRLVRSATSSVIGLTADVPDPRSRTPKTIILPEAEVAIHRVMGIIFDHSLKFANGQDEAVLVDAGDVLRQCGRNP